MLLKPLKYAFWISLFVLSLFFLNKLFLLKHYGAFSEFNSLNSFARHYDLREKADGFYEKKKNSLDVVFFGSSYCHTNINPNVLWAEHGIASYDFSADQQNLALTYYYVEEMFKRQKPRLIVIETSVIPDSKYDANAQLHYSLDPLRLGRAKIKAALKRVKPEEIVEMMFPLVKYHSRWTELSKFDYDYFSNSPKNVFNGNISLMGIASDFSYDSSLAGNVYNLSNVAIDFILKIKRLADKNNAKAFFIFTPLANPSVTDFYRRAIIQFLEKAQIDFYDFNGHFADIQTDMTTDYHDMVHMTYWGNVRFSRHLGNVLKARYDIPDRRNDKSYAEYDADCRATQDVKKRFDSKYKAINNCCPNPKDYQ